MINPRLRETFFGKSDGAGLRSFTPKQVQMIVDELGEPVGIDGIKTSENGNKETYDLGGRRTEKAGHGIYIERKNGRSQKLMK